MIKLVGLVLAAILATGASTPSRSGVKRPLVPQKPGCSLTAMPDVIGQDDASATAELNAARITQIARRILVQDPPPSGPNLLVVSTNPAAGVQFYPCQQWTILTFRWQ